MVVHNVGIEYYYFMPTISMFYGILIRMYLGKKEHNPPHVHAIYQNDKAIFDINTGEKLKGIYLKIRKN